MASMPRWTIALVLAAAGGCAGGAVDAPAPAAGESAAAVAAAQAEVRLPVAGRARLPIELASGKVHVAAELGGERVWALLDTGANMSLIEPAIADRLGLELRNPQTAPDGGFRFAFTRAPALRLGAGTTAPADFVTGPYAVVDRGTQRANGHPSDVLLGADFFRAAVVEIDYPGRTLVLHAPESFRYAGDGTVLPLGFTDHGQPTVEATFAFAGLPPAAGRLLVDTGARDVLVLDAGFLAEHGLSEAFAGARLATVGVGVRGEVRHRLGRLERLAVGPIVDRRVPVTAPASASGPGDRAGVLGARWLGRFRVIFDYPRRRLIVEGPTGPGEREPFDSDASGLFLVAAEAGLEVLGTTEESPATAAGLAAGDLLVAVDGRPAAELGLDRVRELLRRPGRTHRLEVRRGGALRTVELTTRDLSP